MELITIGCYGLPCALQKFTVNGIEADTDDFGEAVSENNGFGGCINNHFVGNIDSSHIKEVCNKYNITYEEYLEIVEHLEDRLDVGDCSWCE